MKYSSTQLTIALIFLSLISCCSISNCQTCSDDGMTCTECANGYQLSGSKVQCESSGNDTSGSPNVGLIVGLTVSIVVGLFLCYFAYKKCVSSSKKGESNVNEHHTTYSYGANFGCMGMVDPMNCFMNQYATTTANICTDKDDYYYNVQIYNKFKNLNERCLDSRNDCDKCAFKLDRKENLFPNWSDLQFTKFTPITPSKKSTKNTKFASYISLIPQNVLEMSVEEMKQAQQQPIYEPIKKNSIDDKFSLTKQDSNTNSEQSNDKEDTASSPCRYKVRSISVATECPSNRGDEVASDEIFSQDSCNEKYAKKEDSSDDNAVVINIDQISCINQNQKCLAPCSQDQSKQPDYITIQIPEQNGLLKQQDQVAINYNDEENKPAVSRDSSSV